MVLSKEEKEWDTHMNYHELNVLLATSFQSSQISMHEADHMIHVHVL